MYEIFEELCKRRGITPYKFCKDTGIRTSTISSWKKKNSLAGSKLSAAICTYFAITYDYLMTGKEDVDEKDETAHSISRTDPDIKKYIDTIMESLEGKDKIVYDGAEVTLTEYNKKLLRRAIETVYDVVENEKDKEHK